MIGVSIVLYRSDVRLLERVVSALAQDGTPVGRLIVHVNAARPGEVEAVRDVVGTCRGPAASDVTASRENQGFSGAHNRVMRSLFEDGCAGVVVLNPDLELAPGAVGSLADAAMAAAAPALFGPVLELADPETLSSTGTVDSLGIVWTRSGRHLDDGQGDPLLDPPPTRPYAVAGISAACLYVPRPAYDAIVAASGEFFDEDFIAYREDAELGLRAAMLGVPSYIVPAARGRHARRLRGTSRGGDPFIDRLGVRNRFLLAFKYGLRRPGWPPLVLLRDLVVLLGVVLRERSSWPGVVEAWKLRHAMREKGRRVRRAAAARQ